MSFQFVLLSFSLLSILGSAFIITSFCLFRQLRSPSGILALWLAVSGGGVAMYYFLTSRQYPILCDIQAIVGTLFPLVSVFTANVMARILYKLFFCPQLYHNDAGLQPHHILYTWLLPLLVSLFPLLVHIYGDQDSTYCWIKANNDTNMSSSIRIAFQFLLFYIPIWVGIFYNIYVFVAISGEVSDIQYQTSVEASRITSTINKIKYYPAISIAVWTFPTLHKITQLCNYDIYWLRVASLLSPSLLGLLDAIAYAATPQVQSQWRNYICCHRNHKHELREEVESVDESVQAAPLYRWSFQSSDMQHTLLPTEEDDFVY